jgi:hypothetical protein
MGSLFLSLLIIFLIFYFSTKKEKIKVIDKRNLGIIRSIPICQTSSIKEVKKGMVVVYDSIEGLVGVKIIDESNLEYIVHIKKLGRRNVCKSEIKALVVESNSIDKNNIRHISYIGLDPIYWQLAIDHNIVDTGDIIEYEIKKCLNNDNSNITEKAILKL